MPERRRKRKLIKIASFIDAILLIIVNTLIYINFGINVDSFVRMLFSSFGILNMTFLIVFVRLQD